MFGFAPQTGSGSTAKQLCAYLREHIESGALAPGLQLPPTRKVAQELGIARNVVIEVYEQLTAEGYLSTRAGSGTYIADGIQTGPAPLLSSAASPSFPERSSSLLEPSAPTRSAPAPTPQTQTQTQPVPGAPENRLIDFDAGTPDLRYFPRKLWSKYVKEVTEYDPDHIFEYGDIQGAKALREAISRYVYKVKGIRCGPEHIVITSGTSESLLLLASSCSDLFQDVYIEEPTIGFTADIFQRMKYNIRPVAVDDQGMVVGDISAAERGGLIVLTPSHQYPTGSILTIQRRQQAVRLAEAAGHYLLEDDYDSEFRHNGGPVPPLQLLAPSRVVYAGTFSKTLSPSLRTGFLIVPPGLIDRVLRTKSDLNLSASGITQSALARFMKDGHFERHIHKMKAIYKKKRIFLTEQCQRLFKGEAQIVGDEAGMHVQLAFRPELYAPIDWSEAEAFGVRLSSFDDYARLKGRHAGKIVLGYGNLTEAEIGEGLLRLYAFMETMKASH